MDYKTAYSAMHMNGKHFTGKSIRPGVSAIAELVASHKPRSLLDYGCGKGHQYSKMEVHKQWGGLLPHCYDVGVEEFSAIPAGPFDGVICTDVMEHIEEADVEHVLTDIFGYLPPRDDGGMSFAYFIIACRPAKRKLLPDGRNVHLTVKEPTWWAARLDQSRSEHLVIAAKFDEGDT